MRSSGDMMRWLVIGALTVAGTFHAADTLAQAEGAEARRVARGYLDTGSRDFILGNLEFLLIHELAHVLIGEKDIPIIGPLEGAADYLATIALIRTQPFDVGHDDQPLDFLLAAADAFSAAWALGSSTGAEIPYWGEHALGIQRYYQIACLLYGSDPARFEGLVQLADLPEARAKSCIAEFEKADRATDWLIETFGRRAEDPVGERGAVVYEEPRTRVAAEILEAIQTSGLIEQTLDRFEALFRLEQPLVAAVRNCGRSEAAWVPERRELVMCYELFNTFYLLSIQHAERGLERVLQ